MDCVMIDRISFEQMKLESEQLRTRTVELERDNEMLKNELTLMKKLNDTLEQIKFNMEKQAQCVREQFTVDETPFDREVTIWQSEYTSIKSMLTQLGLLTTTVDAVNCIINSTESAAELILTAGDHIWTTTTTVGPLNEHSMDSPVSYLCADEQLDNSVVNSDVNEVTVVKTNKVKAKTKRTKAVPLMDGQKRFRCTWNACPYGTDNRGNFQKHYRIHTGEKPYKCQHEGCSYSCSDPARFREHKLIHSTEKAYVCEWPGCTWKFKTHKLLKNHVKACHTGEKPHKCEWPGCEKHFLNKYEVRDHMRQHTGDRPFKCEYPDCLGAFARSNTLTQHIREVHYYKRQYFCDYSECDSRYDRVEDLKCHIRDKHSKQGLDLEDNCHKVIDLNQLKSNKK